MFYIQNQQQNLYNSYLLYPSSNHHQAITLQVFKMIDSCENNSASKKKTCKLQISYKKLTMGFQSYKDIKQAHLKNRACQQSVEYKGNKQCTFQPRLSSKKPEQASQQRRSLKKFLQDQDNFTAAKKKKIEQLRMQMSKQQEDEYKTKPSIDTVSHRLSTQASNKSVSVFQRLSKQKKLVHDVFEQEDMFSPKICIRSKTLRRQKDVSSLLYEDAQRRRQREEIKFEELLKKQFTPQINSNTNNLVIRKIYAEFTQMIKEESISPLTAITVLSEIFNVDLNPNKSSEQQEMCEKVLVFIADTKTETVNSQVLWNFIQTIVNGHLINSNFTEEQEEIILENFAHFYTNRLTKIRKSVTPQKLSFKPKTLRSSQKLAQNYRQRTLSSINEYLENEKVNIDIKNSTVKIEDLFIIEHMRKNSEIEKKRIQKENTQIKQCSFRPNLELSTQTQKTAHKRVSLIVKTTKSQELQKKIKIKKKEEVQNRENQERLKTMYQTSNGIQSKRLNSTTNRNEPKTPKAEVKNIEKNVMRVALARKNRQLVSALNERGYPSNVQNWDNFRRSLKKEVEKSNEKILKGYNSVEKLNSSLLKTSALLTSKQALF